MQAKNISVIRILLLCIGFWGAELLWQLRIILSAPITENLGANPVLYGLILLASPVCGICIQPIIGKFSDITTTHVGKRKPYMLLGAIVASAAAIILPNSAQIANIINIPILTGLLIAAIAIWFADGFLNVVQAPYRALIFDTVDKKDYTKINSCIGFSVGFGAISASAIPILSKILFHRQISISLQFLIGAVILLITMSITCLTVKEPNIRKIPEKNQDTFLQTITNFFKLSPEIAKICMVEFFSWVGVMCILIFLTHFIIHTIFNIPDLSHADNLVKSLYQQKLLTAANYASACFFIFNLTCVIISIPIGILATKYGNKRIHMIALSIMAFAALGIFFAKDIKSVLFLMIMAGVGWASICSLPYAMIMKFMEEKNAASMLGIFNIFIALPQIVSCTLIPFIIQKYKFTTELGYQNYHWEYGFVTAFLCILISIIFTSGLKNET